MRKILLGALLLLSMCVSAQDTFVKKYTSMVSKKEGVIQPWEDTDVTVVFNPNHVRDIVIYYRSGKTLTLHQISGATEGKTEGGEGYQIVQCIDQDGARVAVQLFDNDKCMRVIIADGYMVEFHRD